MKKTIKSLVTVLALCLFTSYGLVVYGSERSEFVNKIKQEAQLKSSQKKYFRHDFANDMRKIHRYDSAHQLSSGGGQYNINSITMEKLRMLVCDDPIKPEDRLSFWQEVGLCSCMVVCVFGVIFFALMITGLVCDGYRYCSEISWQRIKRPKFKLTLVRMCTTTNIVLSTTYIILTQKVSKLLSRIINPPEKPPCFCYVFA